MTEFTKYQRRMWHWLTYFSICRFYIDLDECEEYVIKRAGFFRLFIYYGLWCNSFIKLVYLILTYRGYLVEVHFLDQMSMWDWFLGILILAQETNVWYRKYPLYEVLHANWKVQEDIFKKLGSPRKVQNRILTNDKCLVVMHLTLITVSCSFLTVQLMATPKYALNTYAVVPYDHWILEVLFDIHEVLVIFHIWAHQASSIVLCEVFAASYTHIIREMTIVLKKLIAKGKVQIYEKSHESQFKGHDNICYLVEAKVMQTQLDLRTKVKGTEYDIMTLLADYKKLMLSTTLFNSWVGRFQGGATGCNYGQFVSDVFMMIQLLQEPETDFLAVIFFMEDACAGMIVLFRMLILMSRLYPASEEFLQQFKKYLSHDLSQKKYIIKYQRTLRIVSSKLGGLSVQGITVPKGINALMGWYISAAMWKRPEGRRT